ncbi:MAG: carboxylating nicotinate-nucleotide diphosphorylase [Bdellovibrio sp.]|nr:carboxylating nicotinate-nucleotide diphosphorylase [Bdellovibrio sp.]
MPKVNYIAYLDAGLKEDHWRHDWTTLGVLNNKNKKIQAKIIAKSTGIFAGNGFLKTSKQIALREGFVLSIKSQIKDGACFFPGKVLVTFSGNARFLLALERTLVNLLSYSSGIATQTNKLVIKVKKKWKSLKLHPSITPKILATRKNLPFYRSLALYAVQVGGGFPHRQNLEGGILIKENHIYSAGNIKKAISQAQKYNPKQLKIETEVKTMKDLRGALTLKPEIILLDNFSPRMVKKALIEIRKTNSHSLVEISGGLSEENILKYLMKGVNFLSVGALTHSVKSADFSLLVEN